MGMPTAFWYQWLFILRGQQLTGGTTWNLSIRDFWTTTSVVSVDAITITANELCCGHGEQRSLGRGFPARCVSDL